MSDGEGGAAELRGGPDPAIDGGRAGPAVTMYTMRQAFLEFLDAEYHLVVRFMMRNGAGLCEAEDATQEAFTRGWQKVARGQWPEVTHPRAWIRTVALNHHRKQRRDVAASGAPPEIAEPGPGHAELTGQTLDVVTALNLVDDEDARAVVALDLDDIPGPDIATALGLDEQRVRDLRKKARRILKRHLLSADRTRPTGVEGRERR
jgi:RNA polymerase sigma-70 factor (ECF subfamily)